MAIHLTSIKMTLKETIAVHHSNIQAKMKTY